MASRASSRLSTLAYDTQSRQERRARPSSVSSHTLTIDDNAAAARPFTPSGRRSHLARDSRQSLGLSAVQVDKLSETIASVQRDVRNTDPTVSSASCKGKEREALPASNRLTKPTRSDALTIKQFRQLVTDNHNDYDDEADLNKYTESEYGLNHIGHTADLDLDNVDVVIQEALLVEDLLFILNDCDGSLISPVNSDKAHNNYAIAEAVDPSLASLAARVLPLASHRCIVQSYIDEHGQTQNDFTAQALAAALHTEMDGYFALLVDLEEHFASSSSFSLQRFYHLVQPMMHRMKLLCDLIETFVHFPFPHDEDGSASSSSSDADQIGGDGDHDNTALQDVLRSATRAALDTPGRRWKAAGPVKGGEILTIIEERIHASGGDPIAQSVYNHLLLKASQPYAKMLMHWIRTGNLLDPHGEFIVKEAKVLNKNALDQDYVDQYWENKYTLRDADQSTTGKKSSAATESPSALLERDLRVHHPSSLKKQSRACKRESGMGGGAIVPHFLQSHRDRILLAGKYLNVIRECGQRIIVKDDEDAAVTIIGDIDFQSRDFLSTIDDAYLKANADLLEVLTVQHSLHARLKSLKHNFFLNHGIAFTHFLEAGSSELTKKARHVSLSKLQSLLDMSLSSSFSTVVVDPYSEDVKIALSSSSLYDWLTKIISLSGGPLSTDIDGVDMQTAAHADGTSDTKSVKADDKHATKGIDALSLDYVAHFPLSLVVSRNVILLYQLLFRHLLSFKNAEIQLNATWIEQTKSIIWRGKTVHAGFEAWKSRVFTLRSRMLLWVQQMYAYCVSDIFETNWQRLMVKLEHIKTVEDLLQQHSDFLHACLKEGMLTNAKLLKLHTRLLTTSTLFASHASRLTSGATKLQASALRMVETGEEFDEDHLQECSDFLARFEQNFYRQQKTHFDTVTYYSLSETAALRSLTIRLQHAMPAEDGLPF